MRRKGQTSDFRLETRWAGTTGRGEHSRARCDVIDHVAEQHIEAVLRLFEHEYVERSKVAVGPVVDRRIASASGEGVILDRTKVAQALSQTSLPLLLPAHVV